MVALSEGPHNFISLRASIYHNPALAVDDVK